jgi:hypothetical protein
MRDNQKRKKQLHHTNQRKKQNRRNGSKRKTYCKAKRAANYTTSPNKKKHLNKGINRGIFN